MDTGFDRFLSINLLKNKLSMYTLTLPQYPGQGVWGHANLLFPHNCTYMQTVCFLVSSCHYPLELIENDIYTPRENKSRTLLRTMTILTWLEYMQVCG